MERRKRGESLTQKNERAQKCGAFAALADSSTRPLSFAPESKCNLHGPTLKGSET